MRRLASALFGATFVLAIIMGVVPQAKASAFSAGDGSSESPYKIKTCVQLQAIQDDLSAHYQLAANIDCGNPSGGNDTTAWNEGDGFQPIGDCWGPGFAGTFNGNGHTISNLYINRPGVDRQALFGCTNDGAIIEKVGMVNVDVTGQRYAGGIVGVLVGSNTIIRNVYVSGSVALVLGPIQGSGQFAGGIVSGMEGGAHIYNSYSVADVSTYYHDMWGEGGLSGYAYNGSTASNSFWNTETPSTVLISEGGGTGKTTAQMKTASTYTDAGWDFDTIWDIDGDYPFLRTIAEPTEDTVNLTSAENGSAIVLSESGCSTIASSSSNKESSNNKTDIAYSYPVGFVSFTIENCDNGGTATITLTFSGNFDPAKTTLRKYNAVNKSYTTLTSANSNLSFASTTLSGSPAISATYQITDGGSLDQDGTANGTIIDPVGIGNAVVEAPNTGLGSTTCNTLLIKQVCVSKND